MSTTIGHTFTECMDKYIFPSLGGACMVMGSGSLFVGLMRMLCELHQIVTARDWATLHKVNHALLTPTETWLYNFHANPWYYTYGLAMLGASYFVVLLMNHMVHARKKEYT